jgi:hypothetical protein
VRLLTDGASINEHDVGRVETIDEPEVALDKDRLHQLAVVDVHLTAIGFDVDVVHVRSDVSQGTVIIA